MAKVTLAIGGRHYQVTCRDGGEAHLEALARVVDGKVEEARVAVGTADEVRQLLFAALLLADQANAAPTAVREPAIAADPEADALIADALGALATRVEALADALEDEAAIA